jgi:signal transduction histidine kinase
LTVGIALLSSGITPYLRRLRAVTTADTVEGVNRLRREGPRQVCADLLLWAGLAVLAAVYGPDPLDDLGGFLTIAGARLAAVSLAVLVGRPWPLAALLLLTVATPWSQADGLATLDHVLRPWVGEVKLFPATLLMPGLLWYAYLTGRRLDRVWPAAAALVVLGAVGGVMVAGRDGGSAEPFVTMVSGVLLTYVGPYLLGRLRRRLVLQRGREQSSREEQARLRERTRIARDMHDSLGHDLALIAVRAGGLELSPGLTSEQVRAAGELREAAADATERLRQIVGLLREQGEGAPLTPEGEGVADLVARARDSGMEITLSVSGEPPLAHRVVQEGLTNAAKHAPGARVSVTVAPVGVVVRNGAPQGRPAAVGGGLGLAGLRERVRLAGGTLRAGPLGDGFELRVDLPRVGEADPSASGGP